MKQPLLEEENEQLRNTIELLMKQFNQVSQDLKENVKKLKEEKEYLLNQNIKLREIINSAHKLTNIEDSEEVEKLKEEIKSLKDSAERENRLREMEPNDPYERQKFYDSWSGGFS